MDKIVFTEEQKEILDENFDINIAVLACAGSGKTTLLIERIKRNLELSNKKIVVLTFNNSIKNELKDKILIEKFKKIVVETFHGFTLHFIFPFSNEIQNLNYKINFDRKVNNYSEWKRIFLEENIICGSKNSKDDFIITYGNEILENNKSCQDFIKASFSSVYVDEVQDNNKERFRLLENLLNLELKNFVVGDEKQLINTFTGSSKELFFEYIFSNEKYKKKYLTKNFRCHESINSFAKKSNTNILFYNTLEEEGVFLIKREEDFLEIINSEKSLAILRFKNEDCKAFEKQGFYHRKRNKIFDSKVIEDLINIYFTSKNSIELLKNQGIENLNNKKIIDDFFETPNIELLNKVLIIFNMKDAITEENKYELIKFILTEDNRRFFNYKDEKKITLTIHSSKGLQFENVLIYLKDFYDKNKGFQDELFYVACTRAKTRLYVML